MIFTEWVGNGYIHVAMLFAFGACVGSFLNVVIYRLPYELSLLSPPSSCPKCGKGISGFDNIPILSWIILKGKCRNCAAPISARYPGVELFTAIMWAAVAWFSFNESLAHDSGQLVNAGLLAVRLAFISALIAITFIDYDHQIIPDELSIGGVVFGLIASFLLPNLHQSFVDGYGSASPGVAALLGSAAGAIVGAATMLFLTFISTIFFQKQIKKAQEEDPEITTAIGYGDFKLMAFVGAMLGWKEVLAAWLVGTLFGAIFGSVEKVRSGHWPKDSDDPEDAQISGLLATLWYRWRSGDSVMPYGPALCAGAVVMFFFREPVLDFFAQLFIPYRGLY